MPHRFPGNTNRPSGDLRSATNELIKKIMVFCLLAMACITTHLLPHLQQVLDHACCMSDFPIRAGVSSEGHDVIQQKETIKSETGDDPCLVPLPVQAESSHVIVNDTLLLQEPARRCGKLQRRWNGYSRTDSQSQILVSSIAHRIEEHQTNCSLPVAAFHVDNDFGMGSHLYLWSQALCNAWEAGYRIQTQNPSWLWLDQTYCDPSQARLSPLLCYFPLAESRCHDGGWHLNRDVFAVNVTDPKQEKLRCSWMQREGFLADFRAASMEFLFQRISPLIVQEAERQIGLLFGEAGEVPGDLITVHMRWGDKFFEMDLASEHEYVAAVMQLLAAKKGHSDMNTTAANIYLATEDPRAVQAFRRAAPAAWNIYVDRTIAELNNFRPRRGNRASWTTRNTKGRAGLVALGSLLVALEANSFVLTTKSNWSRLMNELRKNVVDPQCGNCTRVIDLRPGVW